MLFGLDPTTFGSWLGCGLTERVAGRTGVVDAFKRVDSEMNLATDSNVDGAGMGQANPYCLHAMGISRTAIELVSALSGRTGRYADLVSAAIGFGRQRVGSTGKRG